MNKVNQKKREKKQRLLETAFTLFITKGKNETTIQDIVDEAGVAKGTFYLYFKDRYDIISAITAMQTTKLFDNAIQQSRKKQHAHFIDQFLCILDYIIDELTENQPLLQFIYKNLALGINAMQLTAHDFSIGKDRVPKSILELFVRRAKEEALPLKRPDVTLFMIVELVGATCYTSILFERPLPIAEYKPHLYAAIRGMLQESPQVEK